MLVRNGAPCPYSVYLWKSASQINQALTTTPLSPPSQGGDKGEVELKPFNVLLRKEGMKGRSSTYHVRKYLRLPDIQKTRTNKMKIPIQLKYLYQFSFLKTYQGKALC